MKKTLLSLLLSAFALTFTSCGGDEGSITETETAKLNLDLSGRDDYKDIFVSIFTGENNSNPEVKEQVNSKGKVTFNVTKYIGKELIVKVSEKEGNIYSDIDGAIKKLTIKKDINNLSINIPKKETTTPPGKVYEANIKVIQNGKPKEGVTVYAITQQDLSINHDYIVGIGSNYSFLKESKSLKTDAKGIVNFKNLDVSTFKKYSFIVVTDLIYYKDDKHAFYVRKELTLDGTLKQGTITMKNEIIPENAGGIKFSYQYIGTTLEDLNLKPNELPSVHILFYKPSGELIENLSLKGMSAEYGYANLEVGTYLMTVSSHEPYCFPLNETNLDIDSRRRIKIEVKKDEITTLNLVFEKDPSCP